MKAQIAVVWSQDYEKVEINNDLLIGVSFDSLPHTISLPGSEVTFYESVDQTLSIAAKVNDSKCPVLQALADEEFIERDEEGEVVIPVKILE